MSQHNAPPGGPGPMPDLYFPSLAYRLVALLPEASPIGSSLYLQRPCYRLGLCRSKPTHLEVQGGRRGQVVIRVHDRHQRRAVLVGSTHRQALDLVSLVAVAG